MSIACDCNSKSVHNAQNPRVRNPLKVDPTRSKTLRRLYERAFMRRYKQLARDIYQLVVVEDAFGLKQRNTFNQEQNNGQIDRDTREDRKEVGQIDRDGTPKNTSNRRSKELGIENQRFAFMSSPEQLEQFQRWLKTQTDLKVMGGATKATDEAYWNAFVEEGYKKGQGRAWDDTHPKAIAAGKEQVPFFQGTRQEFLRSSFGSPVAVDKVKLLAARVFTDLQGVNAVMASGLTRALTEGMAQGQNPSVIARRMQDEIRGIGMRRATLIARTETTRAHAEGQLDAMEKLGVEKVGVAVEWSTAGDDRVCPLCQPLDGIVMSLKEARGIIPRHPQCRCALKPANVGESQKKQIRGKLKVDKAIDKSVAREIPKGQRGKRTLKEQKKLSRWAGSDLRVSKKRPKSILDDFEFKPKKK